MPAGPTRRRIEAKKGAQLEFEMFKHQAFVGGRDLHLTAKDAALAIQCDAPAGFEGSGLIRLCCAAGLCANCPDFNTPSFELTATDPINFSIVLPSLLAASVVCWILGPKSVHSS